MDEKRKNFMQNPEEKKTWARKRDVRKEAKLKAQKKERWAGESTVHSWGAGGGKVEWEGGWGGGN